MTNEALLAYAESQGCRVDFLPLPETKEIVIQGKRECIALDTKLSRIEEKELAAHALGHCMYGGFYNRYSKYDIIEKSERRADKWAFMKLVPPGLVKEALQNGIVEPWDLADAFDVSCEFMHCALSYYRQVAII